MYIGGGFGCNPGAGRRSAGLGGEGAARAQSHAGGVRGARPVIPRVSARNYPWRNDWVICLEGDVHCGAKIRIIKGNSLS